MPPALQVHGLFDAPKPIDSLLQQSSATTWPRRCSATALARIAGIPSQESPHSIHRAWIVPCCRLISFDASCLARGDVEAATNMSVVARVTCLCIDTAMAQLYTRLTYLFLRGRITKKTCACLLRPRHCLWTHFNLGLDTVNNKKDSTHHGLPNTNERSLSAKSISTLFCWL